MKATRRVVQFLAVLILVITAELIPIPVHASSGYAYVHGTADYRTSRDQLLANVAAARSASASYIALLRQAGTSDAAAEANQIEANYDQETLAINQLSDGPIVELVPMVYVRRLTIMSGPTFLVPALAANQDVGIGTMGFSSWAWDSQYSGGTIQNPISLFEANTLPYATNGGNAANLHTELAQSGTNPWSDTSVYAQEFAYLCVDNACNWEGIAYSMRNCWNITNCSDNVGGGRWHVDIFANFVPSSDGHLFTIANPHRDCNGASGHYNCNVTSALNLAQGTLSGYLCAGTATNFFNAATYTDQSTGVVDNWSGIGNADWTCGGSMYYAMRTSSSWPITQFKLANWPSSVIAVAATNDGSTGETQYAAIRSDGVFVHALRSAAGIWANSGQFIPVGGAPTGLVSVSAAYAGSGNTQYMVVTSAGSLWHCFLYASSQTWSCGGLPAWPTNSVAVAAEWDDNGTANGEAQFVVATAAGVLVHTIRYGDGSWANGGSFYSVPTAPSGVVAVSATWDLNRSESQFLLATSTTDCGCPNLWHGMRYASGSWSGFTNAGWMPSGVERVLGAPDWNIGEAMFAVSIQNGSMLASIRYADGTWANGYAFTPAPGPGSAGALAAAGDGTAGDDHFLVIGP